MSIHSERVLGLQRLQVIASEGDHNISTLTLGSDVSVAACCTDVDA